jgi:2-haloacid dehalogenase
MPITTLVFDAYGTLFDVAGAARIAAGEPGGSGLGPVWPRLAEDWRRKQLEYTWLRAITREHADFEQVTADALDWAMEASGLSDGALRGRLLALYDRLPAYPEVAEMLERAGRAGLDCAILSNGTPRMLKVAADAAGIAGHFKAILSVEDVGVFKPDRAVYGLVGAHLGARPHDVLFISSNGWDVAGAAGFGFQTLWVNRAGLPVDRMPHRPAHVAADLSALASVLDLP